MEIHNASMQQILVAFLLFLSMFIFFNKFVKTKKIRSKNDHLPPGPMKLPILGNLLNLIGPVPHRALYNLSKKYGPLMHLQLGELSVVVVSSPEAAKQVMKTHDINFASRPSILAAEIISYGCTSCCLLCEVKFGSKPKFSDTSITFGPYGDYLRQLRKICTMELFTVKRVKSFRSIREGVDAELVTWIASREGTHINLTERLYSSTYNVTSMAAFGKKTKEREKLLEMIKDVAESASGFDLADLYPSIKLLQTVSRLRRKLMRIHKEMDRILEEIIQDSKLANSNDAKKSSSSTSTHDESEKHEDLLDVLLRFQEDGHEIPLTNDNIKSVLMDILGAGSETSATLMDWVMAEMLKNPRVLETAQEEVRRVFDDSGYADESSIHQLKYMSSFIKETLRLHPPLPLLLPRKSSKDIQIDGYDLPYDTKIIINAWAVSRDPKHWKNADCFEPGRFLDDDKNSKVDFRGNDFEFILFGAGRRMCPGMSFGLASVELPLAMFLYHFDWTLHAHDKEEEMDMAGGFGATNRRVKDLCVVPLIERPLPLV